MYLTTSACCDLTARCFELQRQLQFVSNIPRRMCDLTDAQLSFIENEVMDELGLPDAMYGFDNVYFIGQCAIVASLAKDIRSFPSREHWESQHSWQLNQCVRDVLETYIVNMDDMLNNAMAEGPSEVEWVASLVDTITFYETILEVLTSK